MKKIALFATALFAFVTHVPAMAKKPNPAAVAGKAYKVKLNRKAKVGQTYKYTAQGRFVQGMVITMGGRPFRNNRNAYQVSYAATVTVLAVDKRKQAVQESHKVARLIKLVKNKQSVLLKPGTVVVAKVQGKKTQFTVNGKPASKALKSVLGNVITLKKANEPMDDDVFGTKKPQAVGGSWPVNGAKVASSLSNKNMQIAANNVKGTMTLKGVASVDGHKGLRVLGRINFKSVGIKLPPGFKTHKSLLKVGISGFFPLKKAFGPLRSTKFMVMQFKAGTPKMGKRPAMGMHMNIEHHLTTTRKY